MNSASNSKYAKYSEVDPEFEPYYDTLYKQFDSLWRLPVTEIRHALATASRSFPDDVPTEIDITHQQVTVSDGHQVEIRLYTPKEAGIDRPLFFVTHGGGWTVGTHDIELGICRYVCGKNNAIVLSVDYRLAPEYSFPKPLDDCFEVLKWALENARKLGADPQRVILGGSSAGGNLAAVLALRARDQKLKGIIAQVLNFPIICHPKHFPVDRYEYNSYQQNAESPLLGKNTMEWFWQQYTPSAEPHPYASPLLAQSLSGLPPALIQIGGLDPLRDEEFAYADALRNAGVNVTVKVYPGLPHTFSALPKLTATTKYYAALVNFIDAVLHGSLQPPAS